MGIVATYDPGKVIISFGPVVLQEYAEDSFVTVHRDSPLYTKKMGADGEGARSRSQDQSGSIKVRLLASSPSNDYLTQQAELDHATGQGILPLIVTDALGTSYAHSEQAWVAVMPDMEKAKEIGEVEWEFQSLHIDLNIGSNQVVG